MKVQSALLLGILFTALILVPAGAHLMSLPNKLGMSGDEYLVAQRAYDGWSLSAIGVIGALIATGSLAWLARGDSSIATLTRLAFAFLVATQVIFWTLVFPGNQQTGNWTQLPGHWEALRQRWEYGHAASCVLNLGALLALLAADWRLHLRTGA
jgi:hypothetical protein